MISDVLSTLSAIWGVVGAAIAWLFGYVTGRLRRKRRLRALDRLEPDKAIFLIIWTGGKSDPEPDVREYLQSRGLGPLRGLSYKAPLKEELSDPEVAERLTEDLREMLTELGSGSLREVHLFYAGLVAYAPVIGAMLANWCTVVVYHKKADGYIPLYRLDKEWIQAGRRSFKPLSSPTGWLHSSGYGPGKPSLLG